MTQLGSDPLSTGGSSSSSPLEGMPASSAASPAASRETGTSDSRETGESADPEAGPPASRETGPPADPEGPLPHSAEAPALSGAAPMVTIRPATPADLAAMAGWQCRHVPDGLFPQMGERFVRRWHASFLDSPFGVALVAERHGGSGAGGAAAGGGPDGSAPEGGAPSAGAPAGGAPAEPIGFLVGSTDQVRHVAEVVRRHRAGLAFAGLVALAGRPRLAAHFIRTRARTYLSRIFRNANAGGRQSADSAESGAPTAATITTAADQVAVITAVAVDNAARGSGAGQLLVERFLKEARAAGAPRAELVAMLGEGSAAPFYDRLGWIAVGEHSSRDGSLARTYRYNLS